VAINENDFAEPTNDEIGISLSPLTGINTDDTLRLQVNVQGVQLHASVDTGSTHTFIHDDLARKLGLPLTHRPGLSVKVANGERVTSLGVCCATPLQIGKDTFVVDCFALSLDGFDLVLGIKWLKTLGHVSFDFGGSLDGFLEGQEAYLLARYW